MANELTGVEIKAEAGAVASSSRTVIRSFSVPVETLSTGAADQNLAAAAELNDLSVAQDDFTLVARGEASDPPDEVAQLRLVVMRELELVRALSPELVEQLAEIMALRGTQRQSNIAPGVIPDRALTEVIGDAVVLASAVSDQLESPKLSKDTFKTFYRTAKEAAEDVEWWSERAKNISGNVAQTVANLTGQLRCRAAVSAGTRSEVGRDCRDAFLSLAKTCDKLGVALWDYLGSRFRVAGHIVVQPLDHYVRGRFRPA